MASTGMPIINAIGSSLVAITAFGLTTAINYSVSGMVDWPLALVFVAGGAIGGVAGSLVARRLSNTRGALGMLFAILIILVAIYMLYRRVPA